MLPKIIFSQGVSYSKTNARSIFIQLNFMLCLCYMFPDCIKISVLTEKTMNYKMPSHTSSI